MGIFHMRTYLLAIFLVLSVVTVSNCTRHTLESSLQDNYQPPAGDVVTYRYGSKNETLSVCSEFKDLQDGSRSGCYFQSGCSSCSSWCAYGYYPYYCCDGGVCCCYASSGSCSVNENCYNNYC